MTESGKAEEAIREQEAYSNVMRLASTRYADHLLAELHRLREAEAVARDFVYAVDQSRALGIHPRLKSCLTPFMRLRAAVAPETHDLPSEDQP